MKWFKCVDMRAPVMLKINKAIGKIGAMECLCVVSEAVPLGVKKLDLQMVSGWAAVRVDRAERIMPYAVELLSETWNIYRKTQDKSEDLQISSDISKDLPDNDHSNPHGSTRDLEREKEEERKKETPPSPKFPKSPAGELVNYLYDILKGKGITDTVLNAEWIRIGVNEANLLLRTEPSEVVREAIDWFANDERFWGKRLSRMSNIRKNFIQFQQDRPAAAIKSVAETLLEAASIRNRFEPWEISTQFIERRGDSLWFEGQQLALSEWEAV